MQEPQTTGLPSLGQEDPLGEAMATHSSILAWEIPRTEEPAGYSPWGRKESDMTERLSTGMIHRDGRTDTSLQFEQGRGRVKVPCVQAALPDHF